MNRPKVATSILIFIIVVLYGIKVYETNNLSEQDVYYASLLNQIDDLKKQNAVLKEQVLLHESLTMIKQEAVRAGFIEKEGSLIVP